MGNEGMYGRGMTACWNGEFGHVGTGYEGMLGRRIRASWNEV